jgi:DNA polymerase III gamma/tau subunit
MMDDISKLQKINSIARELIKHGQATSMDEAMKIAIKQVDSGDILSAPAASASAVEAALQDTEEQTAQTPEEDMRAETSGPEPEISSEPAESTTPADTPLSADTSLPEAPEPPKEPEAPVQETVEQQETESSIEQETGQDKAAALEKLFTGQQSILSSLTTTVNNQAKQIEDVTNKINALISEISGLKEELRKIKESPVTSAPLPKKEAKQGQTQFKTEAAPAPAPAPEPEKKTEGGGHARSGDYKPEDVSVEKFFYYGK